MRLVDALKKFNRKERYWLIRSVLGDAGKPLGRHFIVRLHKLGITVPRNAWWAMDYHFDWLAGALHLCQSGGNSDAVQSNEQGAVKGNQEDVDLIIAFDNTLVLIEAKGDSHWDAEQLESKRRRLVACFGDQPERLGIHVFFVFMSTGAPPVVKGWPAWALPNQGEPYWLEMPMAEKDQEPAFYRVVRCSDAEGTVSEVGKYWKIVPQAARWSRTEGESMNDDAASVRETYGPLFTDILKLLHESDPARINYGDNQDEYEPEVRTILPRLHSALSLDDVHTIVHEEFLRWFDADTVGPKDVYASIAEQIWARWCDFRRHPGAAG